LKKQLFTFKSKLFESKNLIVFSYQADSRKEKEHITIDVSTDNIDSTGYLNKAYENGEKLDLADKAKAPFKSHETKAFFVKNHLNKPGQQSFGFLVAKTAVISVITVTSILFWYFMGWEFGLPTFFIALFVVLLITKWHWFYIAAATSKRDLT